ncbi:MAG: AzlC family ABC transporter permease [Proteobacteria bacterium]|nr:AzlC family ABC transporter permease [Pseudomonadota bacterium]
MSGAAAADPRARAFAAGARDILPTMPANAAWALVTGIAMAQSGLPLGQGVGLSLIAYAGSAQLAALPLLVAGAPVWITVLTALMVNLRFVIYSAALSRTFKVLPLGQRLGLGYFIGDISFVLYLRAEERLGSPAERARYFMGLSLVLFFVWHLASLVGLFAAASIPREWGLDFAGLLALVALLAPMLASRPALAGSAVAAVLATLARHWPFRLGLVVAILAGIAVAVALDGRRRSEP